MIGIDIQHAKRAIRELYSFPRTLREGPCDIQKAIEKTRRPMGYDPTLVVEACRACGQEQSIDLDYLTRNCTPMFYRALEKVGGMKQFSAGPGTPNGFTGMSGKRIAEYIRGAVEWWRNNPDSMTDLEPENGWGNSTHALQWWIRFLSACDQHPSGVMEMNG